MNPDLGLPGVPQLHTAAAAERDQDVYAGEQRGPASGEAGKIRRRDHGGKPRDGFS